MVVQKNFVIMVAQVIILALYVMNALLAATLEALMPSRALPVPQGPMLPVLVPRAAPPRAAMQQPSLPMQRSTKAPPQPSAPGDAMTGSSP